MRWVSYGMGCEVCVCAESHRIGVRCVCALGLIWDGM